MSSNQKCIHQKNGWCYLKRLKCDGIDMSELRKLLEYYGIPKCKDFNNNDIEAGGCEE